MVERLTPRLWDIRFSYDMLTEVDAHLIGDDAHRALLGLVQLCAAGLVWTYSPPGDGSLLDDDKFLARITRLQLRRWRRIRPQIEPFFKIVGGKWHLDRPWVEVGGAGRTAIPREVAERVSSRELRRCTYCGATDRPLHFDHIFPVSRGGTNDASNLTLACDACNYSKGSKTLEEWMHG